ncbi:MAG: hypothetical protein OXR62_16195 [Ahrensia sp.]|nr:hypothetical protein [Ahrensia sp.]
MADQITVFRGYQFHRRYFTRLKSGKLGAGRVNDIVEWITGNYDRTFGPSLTEGTSSRELNSNQIVISPIDNTRWFELPRELNSALEAHLRNGKGSEIYSGILDIRFSFLDFLDSCRFIRVVAAESSSTPISWFFEYNGNFFEFDAQKATLQRLSRIIPFTISPTNLVTYADFVLRRLFAREFTVVQSVKDIRELAYQRGGVPNFDIVDAERAFEFPQCFYDDAISRYRGQFDAISYGKLFRYRFEVGANFLDFELIDELEVASINPSPALTEVSYVFHDSQNDASNTDIDHITEFASRSNRGSKLLKILDGNGVGVVRRYGPKTSFLYLHDHQTLIFVLNPNVDVTLAEQAALLILELQRAASQLGGFIPPDPRADITKYAEYSHALNLNSLLGMCEFISEMISSNVDAQPFMDFLHRSGLTKFYEKCVAQRSREELYKEYTEVYYLQKLE